jgi:hypothetical protein
MKKKKLTKPEKRVISVLKPLCGSHKSNPGFCTMYSGTNGEDDILF